MGQPNKRFGFEPGFFTVSRYYYADILQVQHSMFQVGAQYRSFWSIVSDTHVARRLQRPLGLYIIFINQTLDFCVHDYFILGYL